MKTILLFLFISSFPSFIVKENDWELKRNEKGICVYTRIADNSGIKEVRVVNKVKSSLSAIVALLFDSPNYTNWIYKCSEASTLKKISPQEEIQYQVTAVPWPFFNRDVVSDAKAVQDENTKVVTVTSIGTPNYIPVKDGIERVQHYKSVYKLTPLSKDSVNLELIMFVAPGGNVPDWLINATIAEGPFSTTEEMIKQLPKYQSIKLPFITEE